MATPVAERSRQDLANEIRRIRTGLGLTMREFAAQIGVTEATVSRWESAKHIPDSEYLEEIARLAAKKRGTGPGFLSRYLQLRERERMANAVRGVVDSYQIGSHTVQLLSDGSLVINGTVRIDREAPYDDT